jgi:hypothetical protein
MTRFCLPLLYGRYSLHVTQIDKISKGIAYLSAFVSFIENAAKPRPPRLSNSSHPSNMLSHPFLDQRHNLQIVHLHETKVGIP